MRITFSDESDGSSYSTVVHGGMVGAWVDVFLTDGQVCSGIVMVDTDDNELVLSYTNSDTLPLGHPADGGDDNRVKVTAKYEVGLAWDDVAEVKYL